MRRSATRFCTCGGETVTPEQFGAAFPKPENGQEAGIEQLVPTPCPCERLTSVLPGCGLELGMIATLQS
jgi:hypothetical protein